jgi:hypothetical protein
MSCFKNYIYFQILAQNTFSAVRFNKISTEAAIHRQHFITPLLHAPEISEDFIPIYSQGGECFYRECSNLHASANFCFE